MEENFNSALRSLFRSVVREELMATSATQQPSTQPKDTRATIRGIRGLAAYCGISTSTAQRLKSEGRVPYSRIGNRVYFCPSEVDDALKVKEGASC
jgi:hypothetical protein